MEQYKELSREQIEAQLAQKTALVTNLGNALGEKEVLVMELKMEVDIRNQVIANMSKEATPEVAEEPQTSKKRK